MWSSVEIDSWYLSWSFLQHQESIATEFNFKIENGSDRKMYVFNSQSGICEDKARFNFFVLVGKIK